MNVSNVLVVVDTPLDTGRSPLADIIVGVLMMILSAACGIAYSVILTTIFKDKELFKLASYKIMFLLGLYDVLQCIPHFVTGIFTIFQSVGTPLLAKYMGVVATPAYVGYAVCTIILSFNRFIQLMSPNLDRILFQGKSVWAWLALANFIWIIFGIALFLPFATISYNPEWYSWSYDHSYKYSLLVQKIEMYIEVGGIFLSAFFYACVVVMLWRKKKRFMASSNFHAELKILIQASVITLYCTILNVFWHKYEDLLPANIWSYTALNFMWIFNSGVYPVIYVILNKALRQRVRSKVKLSTGATAIFHLQNRGITVAGKSRFS